MLDIAPDYAGIVFGISNTVSKNIAMLMKKNGHILPTGQWYAPSAVINDPLIMPEYARACQSMPEYAKVCQNMPEYARVCQSMPEYARDSSR